MSPSGAQGNNDASGSAVTPDGRYAVFVSDATNLVRLPFHALGVVYERDQLTGRTLVVSQSPTGLIASSFSGDASVSPDGRYVAFTTRDALDGPKPTGWRDVWVRDMHTGTVTRASVPSTGGWSHDNSDNPSISADGRYVSFQSASNAMVPDARGHLLHVYLRDLQTSTTTAIDHNVDGSLSSGALATTSALDAVGDRITYTVSPPGIDAISRVHVRQLTSGADRVVSGPPPPADRYGSRDGRISADGRVVLFLSDQQLTKGAPNGGQFRRDLLSGKLTWASQAPAGSGLTCNLSYFFSLSPNGRYSAYTCTGPVFRATAVIDFTTGSVRRVDVTGDGQPGNGESTPSGVTDTGGVLLTSRATNLVPGPIDYNLHVLFAS